MHGEHARRMFMAASGILSRSNLTEVIIHGEGLLYHLILVVGGHLLGFLLTDARDHCLTEAKSCTEFNRLLHTAVHLHVTQDSCSEPSAWADSILMRKLLAILMAG